MSSTACELHLNKPARKRRKDWSLGDNQRWDSLLESLRQTAWEAGLVGDSEGDRCHCRGVWGHTSRAARNSHHCPETLRSSSCLQMAKSRACEKTAHERESDGKLSQEQRHKQDYKQDRTEGSRTFPTVWRQLSASRGSVSRGWSTNHHFS